MDPIPASPSTGERSLTGLRRAALAGFVVAAALAVGGFVVAWWLGLLALALLPVLPMGFVLAFEALRASR